jgi:branched-chain amino acid transport system substrate-binding protein
MRVYKLLESREAKSVFCAVAIIISGAVSVFLLASRGATLAQDQSGKVKLSVVSFLSGPAAGPFGVPARNAAELILKALNEGSVPAPYGTKGFGGQEVEWKFFDEAGGPQQQVAQYRQLVEREHSNLIIGYISSGDCKALAPVVEELKTPTLYFDCGSPVIFEDVDPNPHYLFRTGPHIAMDEVAVGRYATQANLGIKSLAGINQNYDYGQESWKLFLATMKALQPGIKVTTAQFPKIFAGQYGAEISAILTGKPDLIYSSFWGGDLEGFILQGDARGLFAGRKLLLSAGEPAMYRLAAQIPQGTIICARGPHGVFAPDTPLNRWFRQRYRAAYGTWPTYPSYKVVQAILGAKTAYEKAAQAKGGRTPDAEELVKALEYSKWTGPSGEVELAIAHGHQAIQANAVGRFKYDGAGSEPTLVDVKYYPARCVNPPPDVKSLAWIESGFKGAQCQ